VLIVQKRSFDSTARVEEEEGAEESTATEADGG